MEVADHSSHYNLDAEYFDYFETGTGPDFDVTKRIQDAVLNHSRLIDEALLLDIGSGNGWVYQRMSGKRHTVVSVDIGIANLKRLRRRDGVDTLLVAADAEYLPFRSGCFDQIICSEVLEHLNDPSKMLSETSRIAKQNGTLVASTPYRETLRYYLCIHCNQRTPANAHLHSFDETVLSGLFREAGFADLRIALVQNKLFIGSRLSYALRFLPYSVWSGIDQICNFVYKKMNTIVISGTKK